MVVSYIDGEALRVCFAVGRLPLVRPILPAVLAAAGRVAAATALAGPGPALLRWRACLQAFINNCSDDQQAADWG